MSAYKLGLVEGSTVMPDHPLFHRLGEIRDGMGVIVRSGSRFYGRGLTRIGAQTPGVVGTFADSVVNLFLDVAHVLLLFVGIYAVWQGVQGHWF